ncbi:metal-dependent hydrolase [Actinomadura parmotrematis]|uniref:Metal-dependent hydrolase n=1 Tax=Actinomadura parmotrematis TaxID=2864039 RepID=A0ABS7G0K4_9ACTN|nr:metal-dependent hydrolase [Actinomadura parmotrematis]MBW8486076.1 metal-dependent hydrolase [Actinomadura parmotrematis]
MTVHLGEPENIVLQARDVRFDWAAVPLHWIPGDPVATHFVNVLHLLLPAGEEWFVRVFKETVPHIRDDRLREDVLGFIGQEAVHAASHDGVLDHFLAQGLDVRPFVRQAEFMFEGLLGDRGLTGERAHGWLVERVALIAAIEHFTGVLGDWILNAGALDRAGADPTMLDLLRWHGAEEVEHRHVAHDLFMHLDGSYGARLRAMAQTVTMLLSLWQRGHRFLLDRDPLVRGRIKGGLRHARRTGRAGLTPDGRMLGASVRRYLSRSYSPLNEGSTAQALAYLASSPAAQAALR